MSSADPPTVVLNEISYNGGDTGYRVILSKGADIFGETGKHVAETIAESEDEIPVCIANLRYKLLGWDSVTSDDLERLWDHRPERVGKSAYHFSQAILEDVRRPSPTTEPVTSGDLKNELVEANVSNNGERTAESGKSITHPDSSDITESDYNSIESIESHSDIPEPDCGHLPEYRNNGECLRCDLERQGEQDRAVKRELTADAEPCGRCCESFELDGDGQ